jgi:hypothetical protein
MAQIILYGERRVVVPCPGINTDDIDARWWGYSHTNNKRWIFGYKQLHLTCTTTAIGEIVVPLTTDDVTTTANVLKPGNKMYVCPFDIFFFILFTIFTLYGADPGYGDKNLYDYSKNIGIIWFAM